MAFFEADEIAHDSVLALDDAGVYELGMLQSAMFTTWVKTIAGRLKSDIRMAPDLTYCTFPFPDPTANRSAIEAAAQAVLDCREAHPNDTLADLYDLLTMPEDLVQAHRKLDKAVDKAFRAKAFSGDGERLAFLFKRYEEMTAAAA